MKFTPKTEEQIILESLWPEGIYSFTILDSFIRGGKTFHTKETKSARGNDMIQTIVAVYNDDLKDQILIDYLMPSFPKKLRQACYATNLGEMYESGEVKAEDLIGKSGKLMITIKRESKSEDGSKTYPPKNEIREYIVPNIVQELNDEIPF